MNSLIDELEKAVAVGSMDSYCLDLMKQAAAALRAYLPAPVNCPKGCVGGVEGWVNIGGRSRFRCMACATVWVS